VFHSVQQGSAVIEIDTGKSAAPDLALREHDERAFRPPEWSA